MRSGFVDVLFRVQELHSMVTDLKQRGIEREEGGGEGRGGGRGRERHPEVAAGVDAGPGRGGVCTR